MPTKGLQSLLKDYKDYLHFADQDISPHYFPFGIVALNYAISEDAKGISGGAIIQLLAENKRGKTTLGLDLLSHAQQTSLQEIDINGRKINAAIIDFENTYDKRYAAKLGVDNSKVLVIRGIYAEQAFNIAETLMMDGLQFLLIDSVAMAVPASENDKAFDESAKVAAEAGTISRFLKRVNTIINETQLVVLINQYRANMSPMARSDKKAYGARVIQYVVKLTIELERIKNEADRATVQALISKNKLGGKEGQKVTFDIVYGSGIDYAGHTLDLALQFGIVERKGAWYVYGSEKAQGADNAKETFPMKEIEKKVKDYMEKGD